MSHALVTGAGSGIGAATCARLVAAGHTVTAVGRDPGKLQALARALAPRHGPALQPLPLDLADGPAVHAALSPLTIDWLILAAGTCETAPLAAPEAAAVWRRVLATNLDGPFHCLRALAPRLPQGGRVVAVSSGLGKQGRADYAAYAASKHGLLGLVRCAALELAPRGITVNAVCPGWVDTAMSQADLIRAADRAQTTPAAQRAQAEAAIPLGRFVTADETAALITWLCSPDAAMITGQAYNLSGGELRT